METNKYRILIFFMSAVLLKTPPNNIKLNTIGPMVVPSEFIPPAKFNLWDPVSGGPSDIVKGFADVCCKQNPIAKIKSDNNIKLKDPLLTAGIINVDPMAEMRSP